MPDGMPPRVFFNEFNDDSFNIRLFYWYQPAEHWDFLAFSERLNLEIMRAFEDQQIEFSVPTRVSHSTFTNEEEPLEVRMVQSHQE
jgi:small-conductance mechanosensitive channel